MTLNDIIKDDRFPIALESAFIANPDSEIDMVNRAEAIADLWIGTAVEDQKILDFGAGSGYLSDELTNRKAKIVAYDIKKTRDTKSFFTTNWEEVVERGPYDSVLMYDVIDHLEKESAVDVLKKISTVLKKYHRVKMRCHPWCSRHGTHAFHKINKAFIHLLFSEQELQNAGIVQQPTTKIIHPLATYQGWIKESGIGGISDTKVHKRDVEKRFWDYPLRETIIKHWKDSPLDVNMRKGVGMPIYALGIEFVDMQILRM